MKHRTSTELKGFAEVIRPQELSRKELLERWALALERREGARLHTLRETEYKPAEEQSALREENSPLTVACHFGETVSARVVAARVRRLSGRTSSYAVFAYVYAIAAVLLAGTVLLGH